jgi:hypothetical protein
MYDVCLKCCSEIGQRNGHGKADTCKEFNKIWSLGFAMCYGRHGGTTYQLVNLKSEPPYHCPYILEYTVNKEP